MLTLRATAYEFGPYRLDPMGRSLLRGGEVIALPPKAVEVLMVLIKHPGAVIGKPQLIEAVWPETIVEEANLNQMIFLLRRAFGEDSTSGYIATVPRRGYRFTAGSARSRFRVGSNRSPCCRSRISAAIRLKSILPTASPKP